MLRQAYYALFCQLQRIKAEACSHDDKGRYQELMYYYHWSNLHYITKYRLIDQAWGAKVLRAVHIISLRLAWDVLYSLPSIIILGCQICH